MTAPQSPAPVAGAVEALVAEAKLALGIALDSAESCGHALAGAMSRRRAAEDKQDAIEAINRLAALHPQPAPAVAVEAERLSEMRILQIANKWAKEPGWCDFEKNDFIACARQIVSESLAAAPAVAEKVPLTEAQIDRALGITAGRNISLENTLREVFRVAERAHGIGSGSAQEGQAKSLIDAEPWLKSDEVAERLKGQQ